MFSKHIGNTEIVHQLRRLTTTKKRPHSLIFQGIEGIGKLKIAYEFILEASRISGNNKITNTTEDNLVEAVSQGINHRNHPDIQIINSEKKSISVDLIRAGITFLNTKPILGTLKGLIINDSDKMKASAFNSLLLTLEQPPEDSIIILLTSNKLPDTLLSRCQIVSFNALKFPEFCELLKIKFNANLTETEIKILFSFTQGGLGEFGEMTDLPELKAKIKRIHEIKTLALNLDDAAILKLSHFEDDHEFIIKCIILALREGPPDQKKLKIIDNLIKTQEEMTKRNFNPILGIINSLTV